MTPILRATTLAALSVSGSAWAQAVQNANQIVGDIQFSNAPGGAAYNVLHLPGQGIVNASIRADSINAASPLNASTVAWPPTTPVLVPYELSAEAGGTAVNPLPLDYTLSPPFVSLQTSFPNSRNIYKFENSAIAAGLEIEPAPDVVVDFAECAGVLDIRFVDQNGAPLNISQARADAYPRLDDGSLGSNFQAQANVTAGNAQEYLAVRGDETIWVSIQFTYGSSPFVDQVTEICTLDVDVACNEVVPVTCQGSDSGVGGDLGSIEGIVDMLGEEELHNDTQNTQIRGDTVTLMRATAGPSGNERFAVVGTATPSEGFVTLPNMVPGNYEVQGQMMFRGASDDVYDSQYFLTPIRTDSNGGRITVPAGGVAPLGNTFIMDPGYVVGDLLFQGPPAENSTCLQDLRRAADQDLDGDAYADGVTIGSSSHLRASGVGQLAAGATLTALQGQSFGSFAGGYQLTNGAFVGDYDLSLGGLNSESTLWQVQQLRLHFSDPFDSTDPMAYQASEYTVLDQMIPAAIQVDPGVTQTFDRSYCYGEIQLNIGSNSNNLYNPMVRGGGLFVGNDWQGFPADYEISTLVARGWPLGPQNAAPNGGVTMCLPEGSYTFNPEASVINPGGGTSNTDLNPVDGVLVGCGQTKVVTLELQMDMEAPQCTPEPVVPISGSATSIGGTPVNVNSIDWSTNGGPLNSVCTNCGTNPTFNFNANLQACDNNLVVEGVDSQGNTASVSQLVVQDGVPPEITGCEGMLLPVDPELNGAVPLFNVTAGDNCDGSLPVECVATFPDGSTQVLSGGEVFPLGASTVTCDAMDDCTNTASCSFEVLVQEEPEGCLDITQAQTTCALGPDGVFNGTYNVSLDTTVVDLQGADQLLIPDPNVSPNVVDTNLAAGGSTIIDLQLSNIGVDEVQYCFDVITVNQLDDGTLEECCFDTVCVDLPDCGCLDPEAQVSCIPDGGGDFEVLLSLLNISGDDINHVFLDPVDPSHGLDQTYFDVTTLPAGQGLSLVPVTMSGVAPGEEACIRITGHGDDFDECCDDIVCFDAPTQADQANCDAVPWLVEAPKGRGCATSGAPAGGLGLIGLIGMLIGRRRGRGPTPRRED